MTVRLGVIGGGQLGLYLCEAAKALELEVTVISDTGDAAALSEADRAIMAPLDQVAALQELVASSDVITFDKESIPEAALAYLANAQSQGLIAVFPGVDTMRLLKDKGAQKEWMVQQGLPTLPFDMLPMEGGSVEALSEKYGQIFVQKARCGGFDGRGVQIVDTADSEAALWELPSIVEPFLANCREISVVTVRNQAGEAQTYPPVGMEFDPQLNSVRTVVVPADISVVQSAEAVELAERVVGLLDGVGVFAIEMFITADEKLLINEISPRVHNSGHISLDASNVSQFEQHVRAVAGLPLVSIGASRPGVMLNILYTESIRESCPPSPVVNRLKDGATSVYWYGKEPGTEGRKMGHINAVADDIESAAELASRAMASLSSSERAA